MKVERISLGAAIARTLRENSGLKCPLGCSGSSARFYGLVSHLIDKHALSEKRARKIAEGEFYGAR